MNTECEVLCGVPSLQTAERLDFYLLTKFNNPERSLMLLEDAGYRMSTRHAGNQWAFDAQNTYINLGFDDGEFLDDENYKIDVSE